MIKKITVTTIIKHSDTGCYLLQNWIIKCNDKINSGKIQNFIKPTKTNNPTRDSGATSLTAVGDCFMHLERSSNIHVNNVFVSFERRDITHINIISLIY